MRELVLPLGVIAILASMIIPLPAGILDLMLVSNLVLALMLLLSALYIPEPIRVSSLPTILLLATLYRLALNISTTRMILGRGEGGEMIDAFGHLVINQNLVVGVVVFLVITFVQFIVIAKGSERVAEVSARFTLDALPGKQMSIDADVRAGAIDYHTARRKREELQLESRFYGALDGAMKFVKGDAIAGIVITLVNVIGGLLVGVMVFGLDIQTAVNRFTLLTIGDGLLSQIPALLNSLAAGMIVTRVVGMDGGVPLAREVLTQLGQIPKVKMLVGGLALVFAIVPGLPALPFLVLGVLLLISALSSVVAAAKEKEVLEEPFAPSVRSLIEVKMPTTIFTRLRMGGDLLKMANGFQKLAYERHGLLLSFPMLTPHPDEAGWEILFRGLKYRTFDSLSKDSEVTFILEHLEELLSSRLSECVDDVLTRRMLDYFDSYCPELVSAVVPNIISVTQLTKLIRQLVEEGIGVHNFDQILQAVAENGESVSGDGELLIKVRSSLHRVISHQLSQAGNEQCPSVKVHALDPIADLALSDDVDPEPVKQSAILDQIYEYVSGLKDATPIVLLSAHSRQLVRDFLLNKGVEAKVIAHEELSKDIHIDVVATITIEENDPIPSVSTAHDSAECFM